MSERWHDLSSEAEAWLEKYLPMTLRMTPRQFDKFIFILDLHQKYQFTADELEGIGLLMSRHPMPSRA